MDLQLFRVKILIIFDYFKAYVKNIFSNSLRPWDTQTDLFQYEHNFKISTKTKHKLSKLKNKKIVKSRISSLISHNSSVHLIKNNMATDVSKKSNKVLV